MTFYEALNVHSWKPKSSAYLRKIAQEIKSTSTPSVTSKFITKRTNLIKIPLKLRSNPKMWQFLAFRARLVLNLRFTWLRKNCESQKYKTGPLFRNISSCALCCWIFWDMNTYTPGHLIFAISFAILLTLKIQRTDTPRPRPKKYVLTSKSKKKTLLEPRWNCGNMEGDEVTIIKGPRGGSQVLYAGHRYRFNVPTSKGTIVR